VSRRFAIYYAPSEGSSLEAFGRSWIGRDHVTGNAVEPPRIPGLSAARQRELAAFPWTYGFHATLKAPFELREQRTRNELVDAATAFATGRQRFTAPPLEVQGLSGFIAFKLTQPSPEVDRLAADCVTAFEPFRAPLRPADLERRRAGGLTERQDRYMLSFGYPYVFEEFRFHMTLTGRLQDPERYAVLQELRALAAPLGGRALSVDAICLYEQASRDEPFVLTRRFPFKE
jgi:putative phosphonate metabolism protein